MGQKSQHSGLKNRTTVVQKSLHIGSRIVPQWFKNRSTVVQTDITQWVKNHNTVVTKSYHSGSKSYHSGSK